MHKRKVGAVVIALVVMSAVESRAQNVMRGDTIADLSLEDKILGLSQIWQEVNISFAFPDRLGVNWDSAYKAFLPRVRATADAWSYFRELQRFVALLHDGHSRAYIPPGITPYNAGPWLRVRSLERRAYVWNVGRLLSERIPIGSEILTVNDQPVQDYASAHVLPYIGSSTEHWLWIRGYMDLLLGRHNQGVTIGYVTPAGERRELALSRDRGTRRDEWIAPLTPPRTELRWFANDIAYVALNNFYNDTTAREFEAYLPELKRARGLILDIRRNDGGNSGVGWRIASHLTNDSLVTSRWRTRVHNAAYKSWNRQGYGTMSAWFDGGTHGMIAPAAPDRRIIVPTVVLQDHETFSAAEDFLVAIERVPHITTMGRPSGGSTGNPVLIRVAGIGNAQIVTKRDMYPDGREFVGIGVAPRFVLPGLTVEDLRAGRDPMLDAAVRRVREQLRAR